MIEEETFVEPPEEQEEEPQDEDEFDRLRRKSTMASSVYDDMEYEAEEERTGFFRRFSAVQLIILGILLLLDIAAVGALILIVLGYI